MFTDINGPLVSTNPYEIDPSKIWSVTHSTEIIYTVGQKLCQFVRCLHVSGHHHPAFSIFNGMVDIGDYVFQVTLFMLEFTLTIVTLLITITHQLHYSFLLTIVAYSIIPTLHVRYSDGSRSPQLPSWYLPAEIYTQNQPPPSVVAKP